MVSRRDSSGMDNRINLILIGEEIRNQKLKEFLNVVKDENKINPKDTGLDRNNATAHNDSITPIRDFAIWALSLQADTAKARKA